MSVPENPYSEVTVDTRARQVEGTNAWYMIGLSGIPGPDNEGHTSNAGFVVTDEGVVVYDALGTPALGFEMIRRIREVTDQPIRYVIAGHYHADHIYGLQAFADHTEARIIGQRRAEDYLRGPGAESRLQQRRGVLYPWVDEDTQVIPPDELFDDEYTIELGGKTFRLLHAGPAHSPDDVIMVVEEDGVVFAGDIVFDGRIPFLGDDALDSGNWVNRLEQVEAMEPNFLIPGHGDATANARRAVRFTRDYLVKLREHMAESVEEMMSFEEAYAAMDWSEYENLPAFDQTNRSNANAVFLEMESKLF
ncbi:MBL fold metallo-hydrolase [Thioalkalivibrio halophilus]|uniref:MBL fold metallo-hydrolase n=1 Tax=Thioalkalivibrio halophilus TaxID=252474 RepID=A0A1V2ZYN5_9GAMM|nr:MBL fold metallo-hydrolase [Thioalkalivibrio halophilus]OOC10224.1 MBL fold metallo-hydrolase [Thioalkalivibrio halophilus]